MKIVIRFKHDLKHELFAPFRHDYRKYCHRKTRDTDSNWSISHHPHKKTKNPRLLPDFRRTYPTQAFLILKLSPNNEKIAETSSTKSLPSRSENARQSIQFTSTHPFQPASSSLCTFTPAFRKFLTSYLL